MLTLDHATAKDVDDLAERLSAADAQEMRASGHTVHGSLAGVNALAIRLEGELVALLGVVEDPLFPERGIVWMLSTATVDRVPRRSMASLCAQLVAGWRRHYDSLVNMVYRHNTRAIRFVQWLGFTVYPEPTGPGNQFLMFEWRRDV